MNGHDYLTLAARFPGLRIALFGDFCLDRYLEIDPAREEISIETKLPVRNVVRVRTQPGGAGTILNNLCALGVGRVHPIGFAGEDGEGWELERAIAALPGVDTSSFFRTPERRTFTYTKPLVCGPGEPPVELERLDFKNWTPSPERVATRLAAALREVADSVDAIILLEQVDVAGTGVFTDATLGALDAIARSRPEKLILADSRIGLERFPSVTFKMNAEEFRRFRGLPEGAAIETLRERAAAIASESRRPTFVSLAEAGILGASAGGEVHHAPALPVHGEIDIVGAGDAVTANLVTSLAAGATLRQALEIAMAAASVVIHKLGTTGTASPDEIAGRTHTE